MAAEQQLLIAEEKIITPLVQVLEQAPTRSIEPYQPNKVSPSIRESLDILFPEQQYEEKRIQKTKEILGKLCQEFTESQLRDVVTEIQFLADSWLDDFERKTFGGLTLKELLHEKGSL